MDVKELCMIFLSAAIIHNIVLTHYLGLCPFLGVSTNMRPALVMGLTVTIVMVLTSLVTVPLYRYVLVPFNIEYLRAMSFILVIAAFARLADIILAGISPARHRALGIFLPLVTANCAILGVALLNVDLGFTHAENGFLKAGAGGLGAGAGFTLALALMAGIRERLELAEVPGNLKGLPIALVTASLLALAFLGLGGMKI